MREVTNPTAEHPADRDFEAFVIGALEKSDSEAFESHVMSCGACAKKLEAEAQLEERLYEISAQPKESIDSKAARVVAPVVPIRRRGLRIALAVSAAVAVAAGIALVVMREPPVEHAKQPELDPTPRPTAIPAVVCDSLMEQAECIERAHRRGLYVRYPSGAGAPPIGGASTVGPSSSPFPVSQRRDSR